MECKTLYIIIEGPDDEKYFKWLLGKLQSKFNIRTYTYAKKKNTLVKSLINSIKSMDDADYILFADTDSKDRNKKKKEIQNKYNNCDPDKLFLVEREIESWFLAGISKKDSEILKIKNYSKTDSISKEDFYRIFNSTYEHKIDIFNRIFSIYNIDVAKQKNATFKLFIENCIYLNR